MGKRYWLHVEGFPWNEVSLAQFIQAEQSVGFYPKNGITGAATAGFSVWSIDGMVTRGEVTIATYPKLFSGD